MDISRATEMVERQAYAWEHADAATALEDFAPEGVLISPGGRWTGHEAIRHAMQKYFDKVLSVDVTVTRVLLDGDRGAVEWTWSEIRKADGSRHTADDAIIFTLQNDKIAYWREYFDTANL